MEAGISLKPSGRAIFASTAQLPNAWLPTVSVSPFSVHRTESRSPPGCSRMRLRQRSSRCREPSPWCFPPSSAGRRAEWKGRSLLFPYRLHQAPCFRLRPVPAYRSSDTGHSQWQQKLALSLATVIFSSFGQAENIVNSPFSFRSIAVSDFGREISVSTEQVANAPEPM